MKITFETEARLQMNAWLESTYPDEACGFLVGTISGESRIVQRVIPVENASKENRGRRFRIDPLDYMKTERQLDDTAETLIGIFHSHPDHPARPSSHDLESAQPFFSYVIVSVANGSAEDIRSYRLDGDQFKEEFLSITQLTNQ